MGLNNSFSELDKIDISLYLIYEETEKVMNEVKKDYKDIFQSITAREFKQYLKERYGVF